MSPPGRAKGEFRRAQHEGRPIEPLHVLAMAHDVEASISQITLLVRDGTIELRLRGFHQRRLGDGDWADVVVLQRAAGPQHLRWMRDWQARGVAVVYEIDDLLIDPAAHLVQRDALLRAQGDLRGLLAAANLITASTPPRAAALAGFGPPVLQVPNGSLGYDGTLAQHDRQQPISLIVASSDMQQLGALGDALAQLLGSTGASAVSDQALQLWDMGPVATALQARGLPLRALPLLPMDRFLPTLAALPNPVGLLPLDDSAFSRCKSAVKFFDYTMAGIPCVCAGRLPSGRGAAGRDGPTLRRHLRRLAGGRAAAAGQCRAAQRVGAGGARRRADRPWCGTDGPVLTGGVAAGQHDAPAAGLSLVPAARFGDHRPAVGIATGYSRSQSTSLAKSAVRREDRRRPVRAPRRRPRRLRDPDRHRGTPLTTW